jgi:hypothetical protein
MPLTFLVAARATTVGVLLLPGAVELHRELAGE